MTDLRDQAILDRRRYVPLLPRRFRTVLAPALLMGAAIVATSCAGQGATWEVAVALFVCWIPAVILTDKYTHKYPQRYASYLLASHLKASVVMTAVLGLEWLILGSRWAPLVVVWTALGMFVIADFVVALPWRALPKSAPEPLNATPKQDAESEGAGILALVVDGPTVTASIPDGYPEELRALVERYLTAEAGNADAVLSWPLNGSVPPATESTGLVIVQGRLNDVRRQCRFLRDVAGYLPYGGYVVARYQPLSCHDEELQRRYSGLLYRLVYVLDFLWQRVFPKIPVVNRAYFAFTRGRNRVISRIEIWGRLAYSGLAVIGESEPLDGEVYVLARKEGDPIIDRKPSYYPIVALNKVGLHGERIRVHKVRSMYPFSEFLQKRIFEEHGLSSTGKFANDPRLTEYGPFVRRYWLDEVPQLFDWLRGDIKLVGMRATSPHFLSLYPAELYELYVRIKPGLIPPIFDEETDGFDDIVETELKYLRSYAQAPILTDIRCLGATINDIVFRGVRSE